MSARSACAPRSPTADLFRGHLAHVYSSYETRERLDGPMWVRGGDSLQLLNDGANWRILSITWDAQTAVHPIPARLDAAEP